MRIAHFSWQTKAAIPPAGQWNPAWEFGLS